MSDYKPPVSRDEIIKAIESAFRNRFIHELFGTNPNDAAPYNLLEDELTGMFRDGREDGESVRDMKQACHNHWRESLLELIDKSWDDLRDDILEIVGD